MLGTGCLVSNSSDTSILPPAHAFSFTWQALSVICIAACLKPTPPSTWFLSGVVVMCDNCTAHSFWREPQRQQGEHGGYCCHSLHSVGSIFRALENRQTNKKTPRREHESKGCHQLSWTFVLSFGTRGSRPLPVTKLCFLWWKAFECSCQMWQTGKNTCFPLTHNSMQAHTLDALHVKVHRITTLRARPIAIYAIKRLGDIISKLTGDIPNLTVRKLRFSPHIKSAPVNCSSGVPDWQRKGPSPCTVAQSRLPPQRGMWAESSAESMQQLTGSTINISRFLPPIAMSTCLQKLQRNQGPFGFIIVKKYFSLSFCPHWLRQYSTFPTRLQKWPATYFFSRVWPVLVLWMLKASAVGA